MDVPIEVKARVKAQRMQMLQAQYFDLELQKLMLEATGAPTDKIAAQMQTVDARYNALIAVEVVEDANPA